jgi:hypothetical protein
MALERLARLRERGIECRLDPAQRGEGAIVVEFHAFDLGGDAACAAGAPSGRAAVVRRGRWRLLIEVFSPAA